MRYITMLFLLGVGFMIAGCSGRANLDEPTGGVSGNNKQAGAPVATPTPPPNAPNATAKTTPAAPRNPSNNASGESSSNSQKSDDGTPAQAVALEESSPSNSAASSKSNESASNPAPSTPPSDELVRTNLEKAAELIRVNAKGMENEYPPLLQQIADAFPLFTASTDTQDVRWETVTLFQDGRPLDVIRFRSPLDKPADMFWIWAKEPVRMTWYIIPREGTMRGFSFYRSLRNVEYRDSPLMLPNLVMCQSLLDGQILPGKEYLLWFLRPEEEHPYDSTFAIYLAPHGTAPRATSSSEIALAMGRQLVVQSTPFSVGAMNLRASVLGTGHIGYSSDGNFLAVGSDHESLVLLDTDRYQRTVEIPIGEFDPNHVVYSPDSKLLAASRLYDPQATVDLWDIATRTQMQTISHEAVFTDPNLPPGVVAMKFSKDGGKLFVLFQSHEDPEERKLRLVVWDIAGKKQTGVLSLDKRDAVGFFLTPEEDRLLTLTSEPKPDEVIFIDGDAADPKPSVAPRKTFLTSWDLATLKQVDERTLPVEDVVSYALSPDGRVLATGTAGNLTFWDLAELKPLFTAPQGNRVECCAFSPDGKYLAIGRWDGSVRLWDVAEHRLLTIWRGQLSRVRSLSFSPDGGRLASMSADGIGFAWPVDVTDRLAPSEIIENSLGMTLVHIGEGKFQLGAKWGEQGAASDEAPPRVATILDPFFMSMHEVTVGEFRKFVEATKYVTQAEKDGQGGSIYDFETAAWEQKPDLNWKNPGFTQDDNHPVVQVSWDDAQEFCRWLSNEEKADYRLPTEAEWEYACRGGSKASLFSAHDESSRAAAWETMNCADLAFHSVFAASKEHETWDDHYPHTAPVEKFEPNVFCLHDMHGNVLEWCADWYAPYDRAASTNSPRGPETGEHRVLRGGSFLVPVARCRSAAREHRLPTGRGFNIGFRVVRN